MPDLDEMQEAVLELLGPYGVRRISAFGSVARGEADANSDIDILVDREGPFPKPLGLTRLRSIELELGERLGRKVDLVIDESLSPYVRPYVEADKVVVYEEAV